MDLRDLVKLAGIVNPELLNRIQPTAEVEEADGAGFEDATTRPEEEVMDDPMATYGSDVDLSLRRYLKAKGDHVTVDEDVYPDLTVEDVTEAYGSYKKKKTNEGRMKDSVIHDSETMSKAEFAKKHGKEMADEYYESEKVAEASCGCGSDCGHCGGEHKMSEVGEKCGCCGNMIKETTVQEAKMPDHPDIDDDGDTEEDITKAAEDKKKADESVDMLKKLAGL